MNFKIFCMFLERKRSRIRSFKKRNTCSRDVKHEQKSAIFIHFHKIAKKRGYCRMVVEEEDQRRSWRIFQKPLKAF